ncbi:MAG: hypothetical protein NZ918_01940 [Aigarchaeota archaeon]|nr:hypothetical protein [Aigarchaeota archaeon]
MNEGLAKSGNEPFSRTHIPGLDEVIPGFPRGGLVLVSGLPGSGKTIFGMSYIYYGAVEADEPGVYVSAYEGRNRFLQLSKRLGMDFENLMENGLVEHIWMPVVKEFGVTSTANMILEQVEMMKAKRLVIDSFTAIKESFKEPNEARIFLQSLLSKVLEELQCTTLLIKEGESLPGGIDFEEYVADVVIFLKRGYFEDKVIRILEITKLRGANIPYPRSVYTIKKGIKLLSSIRLPKTRESVPKTLESWPPDPPGMYTTGITDFDHVIGGYPKGSTILIEIDPKCTFMEYSLLVAPTVASFILRGGHYVVIPSGGVGPDLLEELYVVHYGVSREVFRERVHIFYEKGAFINKKPNVIEFNPKPIEDARRRFIEFGLKLVKESGGRVITVIGVDRVVRLAKEEAIHQLALAQDPVGAYRGLMIWLLKPTEPWLVERLAPLADVYIKITRKHGCILVYGVKPRTPLYGIQLDPEKALPIPELIPIV